MLFCDGAYLYLIQMLGVCKMIAKCNCCWLMLLDEYVKWEKKKLQCKLCRIMYVYFPHHLNAFILLSVEDNFAKSCVPSKSFILPTRPFLYYFSTFWKFCNDCRKWSQNCQNLTLCVSLNLQRSSSQFLNSISKFCTFFYSC